MLGSRPAAVLSCRALRKLLRWDQGVLRMAEEKGQDIQPLLALLGAGS